MATKPIITQSRFNSSTIRKGLLHAISKIAAKMTTDSAATAASAGKLFSQDELNKSNHPVRAKLIAKLLKHQSNGIG